jgi:hypothetical protein
VELRLRDADAHPISNARIRVQMFMTHPGMAPIECEVEAHEGGRYQAHVRFTMAGSWIMRVQGTAPDGRPIDLRIGPHEVGPAT